MTTDETAASIDGFSTPRFGQNGAEQAPSAPEYPRRRRLGAASLGHSASWAALTRPYRGSFFYRVPHHAAENASSWPTSVLTVLYSTRYAGVR